MSEELEPDSDDVGALGDLFAAHGARLFDYCRALTGSDAEAASATATALVRARRLPGAPHLLQARLFASARRRALLRGPAGAVRRPEFLLTSADERWSTVLAAFGALAVPHREVLALVYRYGIWPEQLAVVLRVSARDSYELLAAAEHEFVTAAAAGCSGSGSPAAEDIAGIPLVAIPGSVWPDAVARLTGDVGAEPRPPHTRSARPRPRPRLLLAAGAALPVAAFGCWALASGAVSAYPVSASRSGTGVPTSGPVGPATLAVPDRVRAAPRTAGTESPTRPAAPTPPPAAPTVPILALLPTTPAGTVLPVVTPSTTSAPTPAASATVSPSPSPSSAAPSPSASPSPSVSPSPSASPSASPSPAAPSPSASPSDSSAVPDPSPTS